MNIEYLREFVFLTETGNYLSAAEDLFISQSNLSKHIKALETELGVSLFNRTTRAIKLTPEGELLFAYANQIVNIYKAFTDKLEEFKENGVMSLKIGVMPTMAQYDITRIIYAFKTSNPKVNLTITEGDTNDLKVMLDNKEIDLAFLREYTPSAQYNRVTYMSDRLVAVCPKSNPLSEKEHLCLEDLSDEPLVLLKTGTFQFNLCAESFRRLGLKMKVLFTSHHISSIADFVTNGTAIALLMEGQTRFIHNPRNVILDIKPEIPVSIDLCWAKNTPLSRSAKNFIAIARDIKDHLRDFSEPNIPPILPGN